MAWLFLILAVIMLGPFYFWLLKFLAPIILALIIWPLLFGPYYFGPYGMESIGVHVTATLGLIDARLDHVNPLKKFRRNFS